jgi:hypothetical protein
MIDPTGALVIEVRDSLRDAGITDRVRGYEPAPGDSVKPYRRFVVISSLDVPPDPLLPITDARYSFRCYGTTAQDAWAVYIGLVEAVHHTGPRVKSSGLGIYQSWVETGGAADQDPDTKQPLVSGTIHLIATTQVVGS